jgi:hypothetical protein
MMGGKVLATAKYVGAAVTLLGAAWFMFGHFDASGDTEQRSKANEKVVKQLQEIKIKQDTAEEARNRLKKEYCLNGKLTDIDECAKVGVDVR